MEQYIPHIAATIYTVVYFYYVYAVYKALLNSPYYRGFDLLISLLFAPLWPLYLIGEGLHYIARKIDTFAEWLDVKLGINEEGSKEE